MVATRARRLQELAQEALGTQTSCSVTVSTSIKVKVNINVASSSAIATPTAQDADTHMTTEDQISPVAEPVDAASNGSASSSKLEPPPKIRKVVKLRQQPLDFTKAVTRSSAAVQVQAKCTNEDIATTEATSTKNLRAAKRGSTTQDTVNPPAKRSKKTVEQLDEDFEQTDVVETTESVVSVSRQLRVRNKKQNVTGPTQVSENSRGAFITLQVPTLSAFYKKYRVKRKSVTKRNSKKGSIEETKEESESPTEMKFDLNHDRIPFWTSPTWYEVRQVATALEDERPTLTNSATNNGAATAPAHAATGLTVDSLVRVIISQTQSNEAALDTQQALKHAYPYYVNGQIVEGEKPNYHEMREQSLAKLRNVLQTGGLHNIKAGPIKEALDRIYQKNLSLLKPGEVAWYGQDPDATDFVPGLLSMDYVYEIYRTGSTQAVFNELTSFKQVGVKTAACLMSFNMKIPLFAVDTHVANMAKLLG